ncbi:MAG: cation:proton antiporter [Ilumatobacteraceae bacterium]
MILAETTANTTEITFVVLTVVLLLGPFLIAKIRLPATIGLVLGGAIVGPGTLGWLEDGQMDALGDIGLLYLMFMAGLELDLLLFKRYRNAALGFGLITFTCPFVLGIVAGRLLDYSVPTSILLGSIWASHTLVSLSEVKQAGLMGDRAVALTVSATALTDTLALIVLAVVTSGAADDPNGRPMVDLAIGLVVVAVYTMVLLPRLGPWVFRTIATERTTRLVFLIFAFSSAGLMADHFGIEGLVGAFLAGLGVNRLVPAGGPLAERVDFVGNALFVPAFLVFVGTKLDLSALGSVSTLTLAATFLAVVIVGKSLAALITGRIQKLSWPQVGLMTSMSLGQAAATLAAALVGQAVGLFTEDMLNAVLVTVMVTILLSSIGTALFGARVVPEASPDQPLTRTILVGVTPRFTQPEFFQLAAHLASPASGRVIPTRIVDMPDDREAATAELHAAEQAATDEGADVEGVLRFDSSLIDGVLSVAVEEEVSLIMLPWNPALTVTERLVGSAIEEIGRRSPVPVALGHVHRASFDRIILTVPGLTRIQRLDIEVAAQLMAEVAAHATDAECIVIAHPGLRLENLGLPVRHTLVNVHESDIVPTRADLVITTSSHVRSHPFASLESDSPSVLVAAAPFRLRVSSAPTRSPGFLGLGSTRPTPSLPI